MAASNNATIIATLLASTTDSSIINAIPAALILSLNIDVSTISATSLPLSYVIKKLFSYLNKENSFFLFKKAKYYARTQLNTGNLSLITDEKILSLTLTDLTLTDLESLDDSAKVVTIVKLLQASFMQNIYPTSTQVNQ